MPKLAVPTSHFCVLIRNFPLPNPKTSASLVSSVAPGPTPCQMFLSQLAPRLHGSALHRAKTFMVLHHHYLLTPTTPFLLSANFPTFSFAVRSLLSFLHPFVAVMLWWLLLLAPVWAVYVGWPMNEQLPNVARVDQAYLFTLAEITYRSSSNGSVAYAASNLPLWLAFDLQSRTFTGTPTSSDVGEFSISLNGTDSADGSSIANTYSMMVSTSSGLRLSSDDVMFTQIAKFGDTNGVNGLVVREGQHFSLQFDLLVFTENLDASRAISSYYGRSSDRTSLPNWIRFDSSSYTFSGTVPYVTSSIAPSILYGFSFIASDYAGYAGAEGIFYLVVGAHLLSTLLNETIKVNGTYNSKFDYTVPVLSSVYLDDSLIAAENISSVAVDDIPSYISFDKSNYSLSGTFPNSTASDNFTVVVRDVYGNQVSLPYAFDSLGSVFTVSLIPEVNATRGEYFQQQLLRSYFTDYNNTDVSVSVNSSWLTYHSLNMTLSGMTPDDFDSLKVTVNTESDFDSESRSFNVVGIDAKSTTSSSSSSSSSSRATSTSSSSSSASSSSAASQSKSSSSNHKKLVLGLAIGLPAFALLVALLLILLCCCRRRKSKDTDSEKSSQAEPELTGPGFGVTYDMDDHAERARQLGALNALKLDDDNASTLSSLTHVDSENDSCYFDASEKPVKSWRANDTSDSNAIKQSFIKLQRHTSQLSLDTVNTEQLFSVRLVDENSARNSNQSMGNILNLSLSLIRDTSSANIQRLDSDGNVTDLRSDNTSPGPKTLRPVSNLNNIDEEDDSNNTFYNTTNESSNYNLMAKFLNEGAKSTSSETDAESNPSFEEDFEPVKDSMGRVEWRRSHEGLHESPNSETFLHNNELTPKNNINDLYHKNQSRTSIYSNLSEAAANLDGKRGNKAKLVEFTRKGSLRDAAHHQNIAHAGETAQFHDGDSD